MIGIHAPYTWDEATYMACHLASLATQCGIQVSLLSSQAHDMGVHYLWDQEVLSGRRNNFSVWAQKCSHVIWFDVQPQKFAEVRRLGGKNILIALWHRLCEEDMKFMYLYDQVICPSQACLDLLSHRLHGPTYLAVPWDTGMPLSAQNLSFGGKRMLVLLDSATAETIGPLLFHTLYMLLDANDRVNLTIAYNKALTPAAYASLSDLMAKHSNHVAIRRRPSYSDRLEAYATHDWVLSPGVRENVGLYALEAWACGRPTLTFKVSPVTEFIREGRNGILIPCEQIYSDLGFPQASVNGAALLETLREAMSGGQESDLVHFVQNFWDGFRERQEGFRAAWKVLWEGA